MSATSRLKPTLSEAAFFGLPGAVALVLSHTTGADPAGILVVFLTMLGNAVGPQPHILFGSDRQAARLFVLIVGDAGTGGKGTILSAVELLFADADPLWSKHRVISGLQSPEAMIKKVADNSNGDCRLLVVEPEYARLVARMASSGTSFSAQLRNAYDGRLLEIARSAGSGGVGSLVRASSPHISVIGEITPQELLGLHSKLRAAGGLETRFLFVLVSRKGEANPFAAPSPARAPLVARLRGAIESSRARVLEATDPISRYLCCERGVQPNVRMMVANSITERWPSIRAGLPIVSSDFQAMLRRGETHVMRLALTYAIADEATVVTPAHLDAALALWSYCAQSAERIFGTPTGSLPPKVNAKLRGQLFEYLCEQGDWVARSTIMASLLHNNVGKVDFDGIVEALKADGLIEEQRVRHTGGAPRTEYRVIPVTQ